MKKDDFYAIINRQVDHSTLTLETKVSKLLTILIIGGYVVILSYLGMDAMSIETGAAWLGFLASYKGLAITSTSFILLSAFMLKTAWGLYTSPAHLRGGMNNWELLGYALVPAWKGLAILVAFGVTNYGIPSSGL